jgi:hypothetical protein
MKMGFIDDFAILKKIHRKARHFYGTIIKKNGKVWGVLLVDSVSTKNPFKSRVRSEFICFAQTIEIFINMEV